tara:strand:+ start:1505 stop:3352 length:1848 start_codon:yes stop_codon:yes gene_type:complete
MATNITSTQLDFDTIKTSLKTYFESKNEFSDYNFEGAGLNNILDVLAYNTHFNGLMANFAINESFLNTAQLRSSVVSHAETLGYRPRSKSPSNSIIKVNLNLTGVTPLPSIVTMLKGTKFSASTEGGTYNFKTREDYTAISENGIYRFKGSTGSENIIVYEGTSKTKTFLVDSVKEDQVYVIPDKNIDSTSVIVEVYPSTTSDVGKESYTFLQKAIAVDATSTYFDIKESPNGYYEINFGDGTSFGKSPVAGNKIVVTYDSVKGAEANGSTYFTAIDEIAVNGVNKTINVTSETESIGGSFAESIESIRKLAPIQFSAQQRLVTPLDYKGMILTNFPVVTDVAVWGGQDNIPIDYGKVFISLKFADNTSDVVKTTTRNQITSNFTKNLSVMSISNVFLDPYQTFLELDVEFYYNQGLTSNTLSSLKTLVKNYIANHFLTNLGKFEDVFRRSTILTGIDSLEASILGSKMNVKMNQRFEPQLGSNTSYQINFPVSLAAPSLVETRIVSSQFIYGGKTAYLRNVGNSTNIEVVDSILGSTLVSSIGTYTPALGKIELTGFGPTAIVGGTNYIKITARPSDESTISPLRNYVIVLEESSLKVFGNIENNETKIALGTV